ncbi:MAG: glycosyltransferase family protein [Thermoguttaceae bacterium]
MNLNLPNAAPRQSSATSSGRVPLEVDRYVVARAGLAEASMAGKPVVVLCGAWPYGDSGRVTELDSTLDRRYVWLDREAERLAELAAGDGPELRPALPAAWVNVLGLRYYLLKLIRVIEYLTSIEPLGRGERIGLVAGPSDADEVALVAEICRRAGADCSLRQQGGEADEKDSVSEPEEWWRRTVRRMADRLRLPGSGRTGRPRVVFCGNPRFLDPVCEAVHDRGCRAWWLYDRFAVKCFWRWNSCGVRQLTCQDRSPRPGISAGDRIDVPSLQFRGIELGGLVSDWLSRRLAARRRDQCRWQERIESHFRQIGPDLLVMDEDATPMKRIALAVARRHGVRSFVVQHGAPVARFGFAPLEADGIFAWGRSTLEQLERWDVPSDRVFLTGSPSHDQLWQQLARVRRAGARPGRSPRILLLATVPPRDRRPDLIEMNMNTRSYGEMVEAAFAAAEAIPAATLVVKPHPRTKSDPILEAAVARHPGLCVETVGSGSLADSLVGIDCVLSCLSSAGVEATLADVPVIQLVPRGAGQILPADRWGLFGSASDARQLLPLVNDALRRERPGHDRGRGTVFAGADCWDRESCGDSATRITNILLAQIKPGARELRKKLEQGCSRAVAHS